ncbi:MAG TPA: outer membrane beta-barrel protein [Longimicrobium sp.]|jgi:hypothetical protein
MTATHLRWGVPLVALALLFAAPAAAQQRGFTLAEVEELLRSDVSSTRILLLVQQRCIHFDPDDRALAVLSAAGATTELLAGLRQPSQCMTHRGPLPKSSAPPAPPAPAAPDAPQAPATRRSGRPLAFLGFGYANGSFTPDEGDGDGAGHGAAVEFGVGGSHFAVFARGAFAGIDPAEGEAYDLGNSDLGARVVFLPARAILRPYVDAAVSVITMEYTDGEGTQRRSATGFGVSGAGGVRLAVTPRVALDASYRRVFGSISQVGADAPGGLEEGAGGSGGWVMVGLSWTPGANRSPAP